MKPFQTNASQITSERCLYIFVKIDKSYLSFFRFDLTYFISARADVYLMSFSHVKGKDLLIIHIIVDI